MNSKKWYKKLYKKTIYPVALFFKNIVKDIKNYDKANESEQTVFSASYFSCYKGTFVIKANFRSSFSFGFIALCTRQQNENTLKHEYGHRLQLKNIGLYRYIRDVAIPSVKAFNLNRKNKLLFDYYGSPWESEADVLGGVDRQTRNTPWALPNGMTHREMLKAMKAKKE